MNHTPVTLDPHWQEKYAEMIMTPQAALAQIHPGKRIFIGTGCASRRSWSRRWWRGRPKSPTPKSSIS